MLQGLACRAAVNTASKASAAGTLWQVLNTPNEIQPVERDRGTQTVPQGGGRTAAVIEAWTVTQDAASMPSSVEARLQEPSPRHYPQTIADEVGAAAQEHIVYHATMSSMFGPVNALLRHLSIPARYYSQRCECLSWSLLASPSDPYLACYSLKC